MKKKTKSNLFNEFKEKVLSGGDYAYVYDKEDSSLTHDAFNGVFDKWGDPYTTSSSTTATITTSDSITGNPVVIGGGGSATWVYPYYPTTTTTVTTAGTITIPYYSEENFEDEDESFYVVSDTFEDDEELSPKRKFTEGVKEVCFSMVAVPSKQMKKNGTTFPVYFYTPKKKIKEGEKSLLAIISVIMIPYGRSAIARKWHMMNSLSLWKLISVKETRRNDF